MSLPTELNHNVRVFTVPSINPSVGVFTAPRQLIARLFCSSISAGKPSWGSEVVAIQKPTLHIFTYFIINSFQVLLKLLTDSNYLQKSLIWAYFPVVGFCVVLFFPLHPPPFEKPKSLQVSTSKFTIADITEFSEGHQADNGKFYVLPDSISGRVRDKESSKAYQTPLRHPSST